jgi:hypothetical protein
MSSAVLFEAKPPTRQLSVCAHRTAREEETNPMRNDLDPVIQAGAGQITAR